MKSLPFLIAIILLGANTASTAEQIEKELTLSPKWETHPQGAKETLQDLTNLFGDFVSPALTTKPPETPIPIYKEVTYLMPYEEATKALQLDKSLASKNSVACPGFPPNSFFYYTFSGRFEEAYNLLVIVADTAEQVVAIQLVCESPKSERLRKIIWLGEDRGWRTYNFISYRRKAIKRLIIEHLVEANPTPTSPDPRRIKGGISPGTRTPKDPFYLITVTSILYDPKGKDFRMKPLEVSTWFLPLPLAQTILYAVNQSSIN